MGSQSKKKGRKGTSKRAAAVQIPPEKAASGSFPKWIVGVVGLVALTLVVAFWPSNDSGGPTTPNSNGGTVGGDTAAAGSVIDPEAIHSGYVGSESCASCHLEQTELWRASHHFFAERDVEDSDREAFEGAAPFAHGDEVTEVRLNGTEPEIAEGGFADAKSVARVKRVIGETPLRQFLVGGPRGRMQAHEAVYDPAAKEWFSVFGAENREPGEWGHWNGRGMNWNANCASCHNTRFLKGYEASTDTYHSSMAEMSVGCEACHGPRKDHAASYGSGDGMASGTPAFVDKDRMMASCGACHARRFELSGDFVPGDAFDDHYLLTTVDETEVYYADGQVLEEDYVYASFLSSKMHGAGVTCLDCHNAHSGELILPGNDLCMRCHSGGYPNSPVIEPAAHSFHSLDGPGGQCVSCHMPQTTYMERDPRRDHGFTIPDPLLTKELGIPNACNRCHTDQDVDWAITAVDQWYGEKMDRPTRDRARTIAAARRGEVAARAPLIEHLRSAELPYWRAVAADLLEGWAYEPSVRSALTDAISHTNALVRANAIHSLAPLVDQGDAALAEALRPSLEDSSRAVRFEAAWALREDLNLNSPAGRELTQTLAINADQPSGQARLGAFHLSRQDGAKALEHYRQAVEWDPYSPGLRNELAVVYSMVGQSQRALAEMVRACELAPEDPSFRYRLALAQAEVGAMPEAIASLRRTTELDPNYGRAWYNLGLALNGQGDPEGAMNALLRGESVSPRDPQIPYARATILLNLGRVPEAQEAARRALAIEPRFGPAQQLLNSLR